MKWDIALKCYLEVGVGDVPRSLAIYRIIITSPINISLYRTILVYPLPPTFGNILNEDTKKWGRGYGFDIPYLSAFHCFFFFSCFNVTSTSSERIFPQFSSPTRRTMTKPDVVGRENHRMAHATRYSPAFLSYTPDTSAISTAACVLRNRQNRSFSRAL